VAAHAFPAAVVQVGRSREVLWLEAFGSLTYEPDAAPAHAATVFDLASLTKVISTTTLAMQLVDAGRIATGDRIAEWLPDWRGRDREDVTVADLLSHSSGLTAYLPFYRDHTGRREFERAICTLPLEYAPGTQSIYSDLGFMLLGFIFETVTGLSLQQQFEPIATSLLPNAVRFLPPRSWRAGTAPTEVDAWRGRLLQGEVHDENAYALGGVAGHAGLFGAAAGVGRFAEFALRTLGGEDVLADPRTIRAFVARSGVPKSSRALGWDTMRPTSSCGTLMSASAIGHTGFTGTSLWIDPDQDLYVALLTNRVHPSRDNERILKIRPAVHDAILKGTRNKGEGTTA
jgi:CubicO group peptidase (beta-lactamase class C family)